VTAPAETTVNPHILRLIVQNQFQTSPNAFGLWKDYRYRPSQDPDTFISPKDLYHPHPSTNTAIAPEWDETEVFSLYKTKSVELVIDWQNSGSSAKSNEEINRLVHDVLSHPEFQLDKLSHFNTAHKNCKADTANENSPFLWSFMHTTISIDVPSGNKHSPPHSFPIPGLYYRKITCLIQKAFESPLSRHFHLLPFNLFQKHPNGEANE
jgi:hypothetical protein